MAITLPTGDPLITLQDFKDHIRKLDDREDDLLGIYLAAANNWAEHYTGRSLRTKVRADRFHQFPDLRQPFKIYNGPLISVLNLDYIDVNDDPQVITDAVVDCSDGPDYIYPASGTNWPRSNGMPRSVEIQVSIGFATPLAADLKAGVLIYAANLYRNREDDGPPPMASKHLLKPYQRDLL